MYAVRSLRPLAYEDTALIGALEARKGEPMDNKTALGCLGSVITLISIPMWLTLLYVILNSIEVPNWAWIIYIMYVPVCFFAGLTYAAMNAIEE